MYPIENAEIKPLSFEAFTLSYPVHTWDYDWFYIEFLFVVNTCWLPIAWFLNEVHKTDITPS